MNQELLYSFRNRINDNEMMFHIFRNRFGRNKWSIICSAMDWIEVSLDGIDVSILSRNNDNQASIKMISFLTCIDIMWEAVQQLHRVLFDTKEIPFKEDSSVFKQHVSDNVYFKTVRACFAAHPINLQEVFQDDLNDDRWFASWSGGTFSHKDFSVILYSNNPDKESRFFDVSFNDLYEFAEKRYKYLAVLMDQVNSIVDEHYESFRRIPIAAGTDIVSDIEILLEENKQRFNSDYFDYELQKIKRVFRMGAQSSEKNRIAIREYTDALKIELNEIHNKLQKMELEDLANQVNDNIPVEIQYPFSMLSDAVWQEEPCIMFHYAVEEIKTFFDGVLDIDFTMPQEEIYVLACAGAYALNNAMKKEP